VGIMFFVDGGSQVLQRTIYSPESGEYSQKGRGIVSDVATP
jgi:hypothetical protein